MARLTTFRYPIVSGLFYPEREQELRQLLNSWFLSVRPAAQPANAILAPHAAYQYCGNILAAAFRAAIGCKPSGIILISRAHDTQTNGIYLSNFNRFITPLGNLRSDQKAREKLINLSSRVTVSNLLHKGEHCLEVHFPIIRYLFGDTPITPILIRGSEKGARKILKEALEQIWLSYSGRYLVIISANLSEYAPNNSAFKQAQTFWQALQPDSWSRPGLDLNRSVARICAADSLLIWHSYARSLRCQPLDLDCSKAESQNPERAKTVYYGAAAWYS